VIEPDTIIDGRYRVISRIGSGGMADVYLAQDQLLGREVAVKVLHHHFAEDHEFVERFRREASSAAALSHPNIVGIFDRGEWNGTYYIAMEYVAGRSLKAIVREDGALDPTVAIDIVIQILRAARFAHRRGVIHRDLKPHNVILDEEGRARVTDFGIARAGASDMTLTGSIMGTAQYLSPEQAQGFAVSDASDLYSVGVILYELLTGVVPFEGDSAVAIAFKQVSAAPRPPSELNPALAPSLDAIVMRALAKDPAHRYASADELITALQRARDSLPEYSGAGALPAYSAGAAAVAPAGAYEAPPTAASMAVAQHAAGSGAPPMPLAPAHYGAAEEQPPQRGRGNTLWWVALALLLVAGAVAAVLVLGGSPGSVRVPDVTGMREQEASASLRHVGLQAAPSEHSSTTVETGLVISERPAAGERVQKGSRVSIVISNGPAIKGVVDVAGQTPGQALAKLKAEGFKPVKKAQASDKVPAGRVIGTEPSAGTAEVQGSKVVVLVSSGPAPVSVPDLKGESLAEAEAALQKVGLTLGTVTRKPSSAAAPGTVLSQSPGANSSVHAGSAVDLTVAQAPKPKMVAVPTVVGDTEAAAVTAVRAAGLEAQVTPVETSEVPKQGTVLRQSPAAGTRAAKESTVMIFVGVAPTTPSTGPTGTTSPASSSPGASQ